MQIESSVIYTAFEPQQTERYASSKKTLEDNVSSLEINSSKTNSVGLAEISNINERQYLINQCNLISAHIGQFFTSHCGTGSKSSSGFRAAIESEITRYLQSVGTSTAMNLLAEIRANNFKNYL